MRASLPLLPLLLAFLLPGLLGARTADADESDCAALLRQALAAVKEAERQYDADDLVRARAAATPALQISERAFGRCPTSQDACLLGFYAAVYSGDVLEGRRWLDRYTSLTAYGERDPRLHYLRGMFQSRLLGHYDLALRSLERMHALEPRMEPEGRDRLYIETLILYGNALSRLGRFDEAIRQFRTAALVARQTGRKNKEIIARVNLGITLGRDENFKEAGEVFQKLHEEAPENPVWSYQLGLQLASQTRFPEAIAAYRDSLAKQATFPVKPEDAREIQRARLRLANCLKHHALTLDPAQRPKVLKEALDELKTYVKARPDDALGHLYVGVLLYEERDFAGALGYFREAFRLDPNCENTLRFLINAHTELSGPPKPDGSAPTAEEQVAWKAEREGLQKDLEENKAKRKAALEAAAAESGDPLGGCT